MTVLHKKQIVLGALVIMVGVAGYLNWRYEDSADNIETNSNIVAEENQNENLGEATMVGNIENDYFLSCRNNREIARSKSIELLKTAIDNPNISQEAKGKAENQILNISNDIKEEGEIENLIKAKNFDDAVVFINEDSITVTVKTQGLTAPETAKIKDIIVEQTGNNNIKIVEVK